VAKSRFAPYLVGLCAIPAAAPAQEPIALSADQAASLDKAMRMKPDLAGCPQEANAILVCGRRLGGGGQRMEFPREPGEIVRHINEPGSGLAALAADRCTRLCDVGVNINLIEAARAAPRIFRHILGRD
jgi:hypothetical protein